MYAALALEWVGHDMDTNPAWRAMGAPQLRRPWVAEVVIVDGKVDRRFLDGRTDYQRANGIGSRGVTVHYLLEDGAIYEVRHFTSWKSEDRYFCYVENGQIYRCTQEEFLGWLRAF